MSTNLAIPPSIMRQYEQLYNLVEYQTQDGLLTAKQVAEFLHKDPAWLLRATYDGMCPFAFGSNKGVGRGTSCFHSLPFFFYMTQGSLFRAATDKESLPKLLQV